MNPIQNKFTVVALTGKMKKSSLSALCLLALVVFFNSCKPDVTDIGSNLIPEEDKLNMLTYDVPITLQTVREDSFPVYAAGAPISPVLILGSYIDPIFGKASASFASEFTPLQASFTYGTGYTVDSVVLSLEYAGTEPYYGDINKLKGAQRVKVYQLSEDILTDSLTTYYTNHTIGYNPNKLLGEKLVLPNTTSRVYWVKDSVVKEEQPQLRIRLNQDAEQIFANASPTDLANGTAFYNYFKGLYVMVDNSDFQQTGQGALLRFNAGATGACRIRVFYRNSANNADNPFEYFDFVVSSGTRRLNTYQHNYKGTQVAIDMAYPSINNTRYYVQAMSGLKTKVILPNFDTIPEFSDPDAHYVVNKAELFIPVDVDAVSNAYPPPGSLTIFAPSADAQYANRPNPPNTTIRDYTTSGFDYFYGGAYSNSKKAYTFGLGLHLSDILNKKVKNTGLYITASTAATTVKRTVIENTTNRKVTLRLIYTKN